jgi:hypothetical protein
MDEQREKPVVRKAPAPEAQTARVGPDEISEENSFALLSAANNGTATATATAVAEPAVAPAPVKSEQAFQVEQACAEPLRKLIEELDLCRRYYESTFPSKPVDRLIFVGGEARHRPLCQQIARELGLAAQLGDPLVRMGRVSEVSIESGIDRRQPQPAWAVAIGLSMGPVNPATGEQSQTLHGSV